MKLSIFLAIICIVSMQAADQPDLINTFLPEESLVKVIHNKERRGTGWFGCDSSKRRACDEVESTLKQLFEDLEAGEKRGRLFLYSKGVMVFVPPIHYHFQSYFQHELNNSVNTITSNNNITKEEMKIINAALTPAWERAKKVDLAHQEKLQLTQKQSDEERTREAAIAHAAILAQYSK